MSQISSGKSNVHNFHWSKENIRNAPEGFACIIANWWNHKNLIEMQ